MFRRFFPCFFIAVCGFAGCAGGFYRSAWASRTPLYALGYTNRTSADMREVNSYWHENDFDYVDGAGILSAGATKLTSMAPDPIPRQVTITWRTQDGKAHQQTLQVAANVPHIESFSGTIFFKITDAGVVLVPLTDKQMDELGDQGKKYP